MSGKFETGDANYGVVTDPSTGVTTVYFANVSAVQFDGDGMTVTGALNNALEIEAASSATTLRVMSAATNADMILEPKGTGNIAMSVTGAGQSSGTIAMMGDAENIDMILEPKGTGLVRFGAYAAGALSQGGYITMKDAGGTDRLVMVGAP